MKKLIATVLIATALAGCATPKNIEGKTYDTYGILSQHKQDPNIRYAPSFWSIMWSVAFFQTILAPVYFLGFDLYEPVGKKD